MVELEVKILNMDLAMLEKKLISIGAKFISEENQINTIIDNSDNYIQNDLDSYLRIREEVNLDKEEIITMTLKRNLKGKGIRENLELNINIKDKNDKDNMLKILSLLGYETKNIGYKNRKSYEFQNIRFDLDTWDKETYPYPYMEIEVNEKQDLQMALDLLEIPIENVSVESIVELKNKLK